MGTGKREMRKEPRKLNYEKIGIIVVILIVVVIVIISIISSMRNATSIIGGTNDEDSYEENLGAVEEEVAEEQTKTIEEIIAEFGGQTKEQLKQDTYIIEKDGVEYTAYLDGEIVQGRIAPWNGTASQPAIDEAGNVNIYNAEELKWIADQVISGAKNFSGVTITLRSNIDLGARKNESDVWEGTNWTSIIGFLDEIAETQTTTENTTNESNTTETNAQSVVDNTIIQDESIEVIQENLKRFDGVLDGNGFWIRGMNINADKNYQGLFGYSTGTIANLTIKYSNIKGNEVVGGIVGLNGGTIINCNIENIEITGKEKIGGLAGVSMTGSTIQKCTSKGEKIYINGDKYVGGIIGYANNNTAIQECINTSNITGKEYLGGIVGIAFYGTVMESSVNNAKNIAGESYVGGLAGYSQAQIDSCSNHTLDNKEGIVSGNNYVGGLVRSKSRYGYYK